MNSDLPILSIILQKILMNEWRSLQDNRRFGLGLEMEMAKAHHSTIQVQSQLGHGSAFTVKLPVA
jgi:light-regulated signal transduction histidine kinase (bacteriophytochrome)